jgi:ribosomal protein RSM22 (predicted rRNA methylase)
VPNQSLPPNIPSRSEDDTKKSKKAMRESAKRNSANFSLRIGTVALPKQLEERIYQLLRDYPRSWLRQHAASLSRTLRARTTQPLSQALSKDAVESVRWVDVQRTNSEQSSQSPKNMSKPSIQRQQALSSQDKKLPDVPPLQYEKNQSFAYVAHRVPGIYGCNYRVLHEIKVRFPDFQPKVVLDFGSGPGTAVWAARELWPDIKEFHVVEPSEAMTEVSKVLLDGFPVFRRKFLQEGKLVTAQLVVASYSLSELVSDATRRSILRELWSFVAPGGILVVIEPGTPVGFKIIRAARSLLLQLTNNHHPQLTPQIVAPCPHALSCPMAQNSWCHFVQRIQRIAVLKHSKSRATVNWENEKFSYLIFSKGFLPVAFPEGHPNRDLQWSRLTRQPLKRKGHIIIDVCAPEGQLKREIITKKHTKEIFKAAKKAFWGDMFFLDRIVRKSPSKEKRKYFPTTKKRTKELRKLVKAKKRLQNLKSGQQSSSAFLSSPLSTLHTHQKNRTN